jgi:hypothetical protein
MTKVCDGFGWGGGDGGGVGHEERKLVPLGRDYLKSIIPLLWTVSMWNSRWRLPASISRESSRLNWNTARIGRGLRRRRFKPSVAAVSLYKDAPRWKKIKCKHLAPVTRTQTSKAKLVTCRITRIPQHFRESDSSSGHLYPSERNPDLPIQ